MENVYDIRKEKQLQFIFSAEHSKYIPTQTLLGACAVVVNLYYTEMVEEYSTYLNHIPEEIRLYIFSSKEETLEAARKCCNRKNTFFIRKENRGRDLSAFLVAFLPYIDEYELICFIHDKREYHPWEKEDVAKWKENLWENMIAAPYYIYNILQLFENRPELGMLFPPEPMGECIASWYKVFWGDNYKRCIDLAEKMQLEADIRVEKPPISLGSVFWTRRKAILKLTGMNWKYEDFPEEPMPSDYTISHAVERIFEYVAQDAGYDVGTVMTEEYASWLLMFLQDYFKEMYFESYK